MIKLDLRGGIRDVETALQIRLHALPPPASLALAEKE